MWRTLLISNDHQLSLDKNRIVLKNAAGEKTALALEDISAIIVDANQYTVSGNLLSAMAEYGIAFFSCAQNHVPNGVFMPFHSHSRASLMANRQIELTEPFKKRIWQKIIKTKIANQAQCVKLIEKSGHEKLFAMADSVQSGDDGNIESAAARHYWECIFGNFNRQNKTDVRNSLLNYSYAVMRGLLARHLCAYGLLPCFGMHHRSELNAFNLADDIIEPFRPLIDLHVYLLEKQRPVENELTPRDKQTLVDIINKNCKTGDEVVTIMKAAELSCASLAACIREKDFNRLALPSFHIRR